MIVYPLVILFLLYSIYIIIGVVKGYTLTQLVTALSEWWTVGVVFVLLYTIVSVGKTFL